MSDLIKKLAFGIQSAKTPPEESREFFRSLPDEERNAIWAETQLFDDSPSGRPRTLINYDKFEGDGTAGEDYVREMEFGEGMHLLKYIAPEIFNDLYSTAMSEKEPRRWLEESYQHAVNDKENPEKRPFEDFVRYSRLDQVIGGYIQGSKNSNIPTMREGWNKNLPYGRQFREKLKNLETQLGFDGDKNPWFER